MKVCPLHRVKYWPNVGCSQCLARACELLEALFREVKRIDRESLR